MQMTLDGGNVLTLTPAEFYEMVREGEVKDGTRGMRNVLASPTEAKVAAVEHKKPKAGDLIEVTSDGQVGNLSPHGYPVGAILTVRARIDTPDDRVYAGRIPSMRGGMMIHNSFYKVVTRNVVEPQHEFAIGDIVRVTSDHSRGSRNKTGDIAEITKLSEAGSFHVHVLAREDVTQGRHCTSGSYHKEDSLELVVAKKDRKDSAVHE